MIDKLRSIEIKTELKEIIIVDDINTEAIGNMRYLVFSVPEILAIGKDEIQQSLARMKMSEIEKWNGRECVFYCWFDDMARQIRFSTISGIWKQLPFDCGIKLTKSLGDIVDIAFLYTNEEYFNPDLETLDVYVCCG